MQFLPYHLALIAGVLLAGCQTRLKSPEVIADAAMTSLNSRAGKVVDEEERRLVIMEDFKRIQGLFREFRDIQIQHREEMSRLLRDYDSTEEQILSQISLYNELKEQKVREGQDLLQSMNATMKEDERKAMETEIRLVMKSLFGLTSAP